MTSRDELRAKLVQEIHRPIGWAKVGKRGDIYLMDVEQTDTLAESMADWAMRAIDQYCSTVNKELIEQVSSADFVYEVMNAPTNGAARDWIKEELAKKVSQDNE